jgi:hypothetical protein
MISVSVSVTVTVFVPAALVDSSSSVVDSDNEVNFIASASDLPGTNP